MVTERMLVSRELTAKLATQTTMSPQGIARLVGVGILIFVVVIMASSGTYVVKPGYRGVEVRGLATIEDDPLGALRRQIVGRYLDPIPADFQERIDAEERRIIRIRPSRVRVWDFARGRR